MLWCNKQIESFKILNEHRTNLVYNVPSTFHLYPYLVCVSVVPMLQCGMQKNINKHNTVQLLSNSFSSVCTMCGQELHHFSRLIYQKSHILFCFVSTGSIPRPPLNRQLARAGYTYYTERRKAERGSWTNRLYQLGGGGGGGRDWELIKDDRKNMGLCQCNICTIIYILKIVINSTVGLWFTLNEKKIEESG